MATGTPVWRLRTGELLQKWYPSLSDRCIRSASLPVAVICLLAIVSFLPVFWSDFINLDDPAYVFESPYVTGGVGLSNLQRILTSNVLGLWHPLSTITFAVEYSLFGPNPFVYHTTNLLIHITNGVLVLLLLQSMTGALWRSSLVATVFTIHPLRVESVAWIAERKDLLSVLFCLLSIACYVWYVRRRRWSAYGLVVVCMILSLMAKPMFVTLPFLLMFLDWWPLRRLYQRDIEPRAGWTSAPGLLLEKVPLLIVSAASAWFTLAGGVHNDPEGHFHPSSFLAHPFSLRLANGAISYGRYLWKMVWFTELNPFYPMPESWPTWQIMASASLLICVTILVICTARKRPYLAVGWFWYLCALLPVLGVWVQVCEYSIADRYTYVSTLGILIMLVWSIPHWVCDGRIGRLITGLSVCICVLILGGFTYRQATFWTDSISLWHRSLAIDERNPLVHANLGVALAHAGRKDEAILEYRRAIALRPTYTTATRNLGFILINRSPDDSRKGFQRAIELDPYDDASLAGLAILSHRSGRSDEAMLFCERAIGVNPLNERANSVRGDLLAAEGQYDEAISCYDTALSVAAKRDGLLARKGNALVELKKPADAVACFVEAISVNPDSVEAHVGLGRLLLSQGRTPEAIWHLTVAYRLAPEDPKVKRAYEEAVANGANGTASP